MGIIVQKYGGSSLSDSQKIEIIANKIIAKKREGNDLVVIVSAMGKTTNNLIASANEVSNNPDKREMDMLLSAGERITMSLLCIKLIDLGYSAVSLTGSQAGIITNDSHTSARIIEIRPFRVQDELQNGKIVVISGFQGISYKRDVTTLGRGGSDTSAVALAAALDAECCEIYSDVDGVYSSDPNVVNSAVHIPELSYQQMQEMSISGAKVLNSQAIEFAKKSSIAIYARSSFNSSKETIIRKMVKEKLISVNSVVFEKNILRVNINGVNISKKLQKVYSLLNENNVPIKELNSQFDDSELDSNTTFLISNNDIYNWESIESSLRDICQKSLTIDKDFSTISLIGEGISQDISILLDTQLLLENNKIEIFGIATTSFRISLLINKKELEGAVNLIHSHFIK